MFDIVKVEWSDSITYAERMPVSEASKSKLARCKTVGFLVYKDEEKIVVAHQLLELGSLETIMSDYTVIPKDWVIDILEIGKEKNNEG